MSSDNQVSQKLAAVAAEYLTAFGPDLVGIIQYGSSVRPDFDPKKSDINLLVCLSEKGIDQLEKAQPLVARWRRQRVATPLFLTEAYIQSSLDSFPIEFLNISSNYRVVTGKDVLAGISFQPEHIRLQCEREIKGKLLLLRERYVETEGKPRLLRELLAASLPDLIYVFNGLLFLRGKEVPATKAETARLLAAELDLDVELFADLWLVAAGTKKVDGDGIKELFRRYLAEIRRLALMLDSDDLDQ